MAQNIGRSFTSLKAKKSQIKPRKKESVGEETAPISKVDPPPPKKAIPTRKNQACFPSLKLRVFDLTSGAAWRRAPPGSFHRHSWHVRLATWSKSRSRVRLRPSERSESQRRSLRWRGRAVGLATVEQKRRKRKVLLLVLK